MTVNLFLYRISLARVNRVIIAAAADDEDEDDDDDDDDDQGGHTSCWPGYIPRHDLQDGFRNIFLEQLRVWFANVESGIRSGLTFQLKRRCLIHLRRNAPGTSPFDMDFNLKTKVS